MAPLYRNKELASGVNIHYVMAPATNSKHNNRRTILLLHGFPTSSFQYRFLIRRLNDQGYNVFAPDLPGFGHTTVPEGFEWTFDNLGKAMREWLQTMGVRRFAAYIFDYGAPVFFRLVEGADFKITGLISQNGNLYEEGLGMPWWANRRTWWAEGKVDTAEFREQNRALLGKPLKIQYVAGTPEDRLDRLDPTTWESDYKFNIQGNEERLLDLFYDYGDNVRRYPDWQKWLKSSGIPILAMWGKNDPSFTAPGAEAIKRDIPETELVFLDGGHFVLETHLDEAVEAMDGFLGKLDWTI